MSASIKTIPVDSRHAARRPSPQTTGRSTSTLLMVGQQAEGSTRPTIRVMQGDVSGIVDRVDAALSTANLGIYQRGGLLVRPALVSITVTDGRKVEGQRIHEIGDHALAETFGRAAIWERFDGRSKEWVEVDPPMKAVSTYRERVGLWNLPVLAGIINAPTLRPDGSILDRPGYDAATGLLYDPRGATFPEVLEYPTHDDADHALNVLKDAIGTFPFVAEVDRSVALSALLTQTIRRSLPSAPLVGYRAPVAGSGKSKLVDMGSAIVTGREAAVISQGQDETELEKRLGALFLAGESCIAIDNCEAPLGGQFLCQALTQSMVRARILGRSEAPELPSTAFITATGNNLTLLGDMTRRALLCSLDPKCERPELIKFDREPVAYAKENRGELLVAALTILRAFVVAGRPPQATPLGSFEGWSRWVRDALLWLGEADPAETLETARGLDPQLAALTAVISQWHSILHDERVSTRQIIEAATRHDVVAPEFREALLAVAGAGGAINGRRLGHWINGQVGRIVGVNDEDGRPIGRYRIEAGGERGGSGTYILRQA